MAQKIVVFPFTIIAVAVKPKKGADLHLHKQSFKILVCTATKNHRQKLLKLQPHWKQMTFYKLHKSNMAVIN